MAENMEQMMKQARLLQQKMEEMQKKLEGCEMTGHAGGGLVSICMNGKMEALQVNLNTDLFNGKLTPDDIAAVEDLLRVAFNDTREKVEAHIQDQMQAITGGMG